MHHDFMMEAIRLSKEGMDQDQGGPFGCVIVKNGVIIGRGINKVTSTNDPTAHAEMVAIREACQHLHSFQLDDCVIYASCEPCPMCLGAIYWARPAKVFYGCSREDAARIDFDDSFIYAEISKPVADRHIIMEQLLRDAAVQVFTDWSGKENKVKY